MVEMIEQSDAIVYVEPGTCSRGALQAGLAGLTVAGDNRLMRVRVATGRSEADVMGSIGHELWHGTEVLGDPTVRNMETMFCFFQREGVLRPYGFETSAGVRAGDRVRREVRRFARRIDSHGPLQLRACRTPSSSPPSALPPASSWAA